MDCKLVKQNIQRLINHELNSDEEEEMLKHLESCSECNDEYKQELQIEDEFTKIFSTNDIQFKSSRRNIMNSIDKDRYGKSSLQNISFAIKRNIKRAYKIAIILILIPLAPVVAKTINFNLNNSTNQEATGSMANKQQTTEKQESSIISSSNTKSSASSREDKIQNGEKQEPSIGSSSNIRNNDSEVKSSKIQNDEVKVFSKDEINKEDMNLLKPDNMTPWISFKASSYSASIVGKGNEAQEEGYSKLYIKKNNDLAYKFTLINEEKLQKTIKSIAWLDDKSILIVVANAHGTIISGSALYLLDVKDESCRLIFSPDSARQRIKSIRVDSSTNSGIKIDMVEYTDDSLNEYKSFVKDVLISKVVEK